MAQSIATRAKLASCSARPAPFATIAPIGFALSRRGHVLSLLRKLHCRSQHHPLLASRLRACSLVPRVTSEHPVLICGYPGLTFGQAGPTFDQPALRLSFF